MNTQRKRAPVAINPTACDRCHGQKLRCDRGSPEPNSSSNTTVTTFKACLRCVKAHATCTTTLRRRTGRPRISEREGSGSQSRLRTSSGQLPSHSEERNEVVEFNDLHLSSEQGVIEESEESTDLAGMETLSSPAGNSMWSLPSFDSLGLFAPPNLSFQAHSQLNSLSHYQPKINETVISPSINLQHGASLQETEVFGEINTTQTHEELQITRNPSFDSTSNHDSSFSHSVATSTSTNGTTNSSPRLTPQIETALPPASTSALQTLCTTKLSSLTSDLLVDVDTLNRGQLGAVLCSSSEQPGKVAIVMGRTEKDHYPIAKLLLSFQRLLEVLRGIDFLCPTFRTEWDASSSFFPRNTPIAKDANVVDEDVSVQTNNSQPGGRSQMPLPLRSLRRRDASKLELSTLLALLSSYSSLIRCCSLILSCIFTSLLNHASSAAADSRLPPAGDQQTIEIETLCRAIWRMVTHIELRLLAMASFDFQGSEGIGREFWDGAMPHLGNRREGWKKRGEESLNQMVKEITILSYNIRC